MRAGFGLVSVLICIGVIAFLIGKGGWFDSANSKETKDAKETVNQIAGNSRDGSMKFMDSLTVDPESKGGKIIAVNVTGVVAGGPAETAYGLKEGDAILEIGPLAVKDNIQSASDALGQLQQFGYSASAPIKIMRDGHQMTLECKQKPGKSSSPAPAPTAKGGGSGSKDAIGQQLDGIQSRGGL